MNSNLHEVVDRLSIIVCNLDEYVIEHREMVNQYDAKVKLNKALTLLSEVYQELGIKLIK
jgi:hypothetical protein